METGLQNLYRDGLVAGFATYPLRADDKPRAAWPQGIKPLPLTLEGEDGHGPYAWADEFADMVGQIKAKHAAAQKVAQPVPPPAKTLDQLRAELADAQSGFDPAYAFSDDHSFYCAQLSKASRIAELSKQIAAREGGAK